MDDVYPVIADAFRENRSAALATLIKHTGSTPRETGTRFLVLEGGETHGTIGGGLLESRVHEEALNAARTGRASRFLYHLTGTDVEDSDMICGGDCEVFIEPLSPGNDQHLAIYEAVHRGLEQGTTGVVAMALDPQRWGEGQIPKVFLEADGTLTGSILGAREMTPELVRALEGFRGRRKPELARLKDETGEAFEVLIEPVRLDPVLYIFGGGYVSSELVPVAARVGFRVVVLDDRPEFADPQRFPAAHEVRNASFDGVMEDLPVDASSFLVIVTRGHTHDMTVLQQALRTDARYVGMIGSSRKIDIIYRRLMEEGATREQLDRVHAPIGLDIGAETPEEIAVSIVAELIMNRAGGGKRTPKS